MANNEKLMNAKEVKFDEFYTEYSTISDELTHYRKHLKGKIIYLNCDDPSSSNFWRYFHNNFASLGLKKLVATHYVKDSEPSYMIEYAGGNDFDMDAGKISTIYGDENYTAGDFRSKDCIKLLKNVDIVCTNPPFSLFGEYIKQLFDFEKKFIIIGNMNASHNKNIFPLFRDNKIWYGASLHSGGVDFRLPDDIEYYSSNVFKKNGKPYINLAGIRWYTNLDISYRHDGLWHKNGEFDKTISHNYFEGNEDNYIHYVNFDAIDIKSANEIPIDYHGMMGVPVTFLDKYNPDEFEIIGIGSGSMAAEIGVKRNYRGRTDIAYTIDGKSKCPFSRIIIVNKKPISMKEDTGY